MKKPFDELQRREELRQSIIGLGEKSLRKSYYPELQKQLRQLETTNKALLNEIQERKKAEEQKKKLESQLRQVQKMEAIGSLAGGIAHDFNNILSAIIGYAELAKAHIQGNCSFGACPADHDLDGVLRSADRAKQLVRRILSFSRQQEGTKKPVELNLLVLDTIKMLRAVIPTTIAIEHDLQPTESTVMADATQLNQVLMNLGTNAYHAMRQTGGILSFELKELDIDLDDHKHTELHIPAGPSLVLRISDTGCGMDPQTLERIFDPYFTTKADQGGTGLGLSVVHSIITAHHGHITVYSEVGKGTTFHLYLPRIRIVPKAKPQTSSATVVGGTEHLLVVDDEPALVEILQRLLTGLGYSVTSTTSSLEASKLFSQAPERFDLVITDMNMPELNGLDLIQLMRVSRSDIPVVLCTGFSELMNSQNTEAMGAIKHIMKPVMRSELSQAIRSLLSAAYGESQPKAP